MLPVAGGGGISLWPHYRLHSLLHCALASCGAVYCIQSCLWVCDSGPMGGVRTLLQPASAQCLRLSEHFFSLQLQIWKSNTVLLVLMSDLSMTAIVSWHYMMSLFTASAWLRDHQTAKERWWTICLTWTLLQNSMHAMIFEKSSESWYFLLHPSDSDTE